MITTGGHPSLSGTAAKKCLLLRNLCLSGTLEEVYSNMAGTTIKIMSL
jgi:hypothetical protein